MFGSVVASAFTLTLLARQARAPIPAAAKQAVGHCTTAAFVEAAQVPAHLQASLTQAVTTACSAGRQQACSVGAVVTVLGALLAPWLLPGGTDEAHALDEWLAFEA